jgi:hypothetical protein
MKRCLCEDDRPRSLYLQPHTELVNWLGPYCLVHSCGTNRETETRNSGIMNKAETLLIVLPCNAAARSVSSEESCRIVDEGACK